MTPVQILFFSVLREQIGCGSIEFDLREPQSAGKVLEQLIQQYPAIKPFREAIRIAVNQTYVGPNHVVQSGDEVALITPVSGG